MKNASNLQPLCEVAARLGKDHALVQGPGGNASVKLGDQLWVKASGRWLAEALERPVFVPLSLAAVRAGLAAGEADSFQDAVIDAHLHQGLKPSIETALHALMPHLAVIHAHSVSSTTTAVLTDGQARASRLLDGVVRWAWIPYRRPGGPLAAAVAASLAASPSDVLLLENHGVAVGAETPEAAETLLRTVENKLNLEVRPLVSRSLLPVQEDGYEMLPEFSSLAFDAEVRNMLSAAPLMPDQVVFLGGGVPVGKPGEAVAMVAERVNASLGIRPVLILLPDVGAYALSDRSPGAASLIECLYEVARRVPAGASVRGLSPSAVAELMGWDAEKYRQALDRQRQ